MQRDIAGLSLPWFYYIIGEVILAGNDIHKYHPVSATTVLKCILENHILTCQWLKMEMCSYVSLEEDGLVL